MRKLLVLVLFLIVGCAGSKEFQAATELHKQGQYQEALQRVGEASKADPTNEQYLKLNREINEKIFAQKFSALNQQYRSTPREDYDRRSTILRELIKVSATLSVFNSAYKGYEKKFTDELESAQKEKQVIAESLPKTIALFNSGQYGKGLEALLALRDYKSSVATVDDFFNSLRGQYGGGLKEYLGDALRRGDLRKLPEQLNLIDSILGESDITSDCRNRTATLFRDKGDLFLNSKKPATAVFYYSLSNVFKKDSVQKHLLQAVRGRFKDYGEKIYLELKGPLDAKQQENCLNLIFSTIDGYYPDLFVRADRLKDASIAIPLSIDRFEHNVQSSKPQTKYSKFISRYERRPNVLFLKAKQAAEEARFQLSLLAGQQVYGVFDGVAKAIAQTAWQAALFKSQDAMNSPEAFDDVPIHVDYSYSQTDTTVHNLIHVRYKVYDLRARNVFAEKTARDEELRQIAVLENVHPQDANKLQNSGAFDYEARRGEFIKFANELLRETANTIAKDTRGIYTERAADYKRIGEISDALDSHVVSQLMSSSLVADPYQLLPEDMFEKVVSLNPESRLAQKIAGKPDLLASLVGDGLTRREIQKAPLPETKRYAETELPKLIQDSVAKVVLVRAVGKDGISQGSGFFISDKGHIVSNHHVIENSAAILVKLLDGTEHVAQVLRSDSAADLVLLKIEVRDTPFFRFGAYETTAPGETVIAIGAPLGFEQTVSKGIVSAKREAGSSISGTVLMIQTDAQITKGNSGGPLVNLNGEAIAVNTLKGPGPLGFAVSIIEVLKRFSSVVR